MSRACCRYYDLRPRPVLGGGGASRWQTRPGDADRLDKGIWPQEEYANDQTETIVGPGIALVIAAHISARIVAPRRDRERHTEEALGEESPEDERVRVPLLILRHGSG